MIYLDNAATGGFKPYLSIQSAEYALKYLIANPGRSGHRLSIVAEEFIYKTRKELAELFGAEDLSRVILTKNCTEALNIALLGTAKKGGHIIISCYEHNSVIRPLEMLKSWGVIDYSVCYPTTDKITAQDIAPLIKNNTYLVCINGVSNVTGVENDISGIGNFLKKENLLFMVDGAQACGHTLIDMQKMGINILCFAGHKGLNGIMGTGGLVFDKSVEIKPVFSGGSGTETFSAIPSAYPEKLESGTMNLPAICSLYEGAIYTKQNLGFFQKTLLNLTDSTIKLLSPLALKFYSKPNTAGIVAVESSTIDSVTLCSMLSEKYDIATRGGFHCAPLVHKFLGTQDSGLLRISLSPLNTYYEIKKLYYSLKEILNSF